MNKPNFCFNCGGSFSPGASSTASQVQQQAIQLDNDSEENDVLNVPDIKKLQVDINVQENAGIKIENLMGTSMGGPHNEPRGDSGLSDEELVQGLLNEGRALRSSKQRPDNDG